MKKLIQLFLLSFLIFMSLSFIKKSEQSVLDFKLKNVDGREISLSDYPNAKGFIIVFTCNHCPFAKLYPKRLNALQLKYQNLGVPLIAISSTDTVMYESDSFLKMVEKSKIEEFNFPYLYDATQKVAKDFKAQKTPHVYVLWKEDNKYVIKYNGAIDDNGAEQENVKNPYVQMAVDALLSNNKIKVKETKSIGCQIYFRN